MLDRVATARRTQRAFVADAAHELRSPLATMRTQLEVATRLGEGGRLPAEQMPEVARLSALVEDLLLLARADDDRSAPRVTARSSWDRWSRTSSAGMRRRGFRFGARSRLGWARPACWRRTTTSTGR